MAEKETKPDTVSRYQYEGMESILQMIIKRQTWALVISVVLLAGVAIYSYYSLANANKNLLEAHESTLEYLSQYDYFSETVTVDSADGGNANYIGNDGDIYNGEGDSQKEKTN